jgi:hypothetical protein
MDKFGVPFAQVPNFGEPVNIRSWLGTGKAMRIASEFTDFTESQLNLIQIYGVRAKAITATNESSHAILASTRPWRPFFFQRNKISVMSFRGRQ